MVKGTGVIAPARFAVPQEVIDSIFERVNVGEPGECWPWMQGCKPSGHGHLNYKVDGHSSSTSAHRVAWMAVNGPIPVGLVVDHLCRNRPCCNPTHLQLLTLSQNSRRNVYAAMTHCKRGHEFNDDNTHVNKLGHRICLACARRHNGIARARKKAV